MATGRLSRAVDVFNVATHFSILARKSLDDLGKGPVVDKGSVFPDDDQVTRLQVCLGSPPLLQAL